MFLPPPPSITVRGNRFTFVEEAGLGGGAVAVVTGAHTAPCCHPLSTATCASKLTISETPTAFQFKSSKRGCFSVPECGGGPQPCDGQHAPQRRHARRPHAPGLLPGTSCPLRSLARSLIHPSITISTLLPLLSIHYKDRFFISIYFSVFRLDLASAPSPKVEK